MITLDTNNYMLLSMFNISPKKVSDQYSGMSIEEIMKAEAAQGNTAAANFDMTILNDPVKLIELFQLNDVGNKYAILSNMSERDLKDLLPTLDKADLVAGLNFFTKDKLLDLVQSLPPEQLLKFVFEMFSPEQLIQLMPEQQLNKFLQSDKIDKGMELEMLKSMNPQILAQMIESVTGKPAAGIQPAGLDGQAKANAQSLYAQIESLPEDKFQEAMLNIPPQHKRIFILQMTQADPKLFQLFDPSAYTDIVNSKKEKQDIVQASNAIEPDQLVKMLGQLPADLTAIVMTQIDPKQFADVLIANFKDILGQICAG